MEDLVDTGRQRKLLILYLFIGNIAADCPIPQHGENTVLTEESLLKNSFPDGTVITYECRNGYYKVSGTETMNCVDGKWTEPDIICRKKECGLLEAQPHMLFDTSEGTQFGAMVKITCEEGYRVIGWNYRLCMNTGWYGKGDCVLVTCPIPTKVENGEHSWSSDDKPEYQQTIHFSCNTGYTMVGNKTIRCTKTGKYDFGPPQCIAFCPIPKGGENMNLTDESLLKKDFPAGTEVTHECIIGYEKVSGTGIMKCDDGKWTTPDIICRKKDCGLPKAQPHMLFDTSQGTLFGAVVKVTCEEGYYINGMSNKQCLDTGWFGTASCVIFTCSKPTKVENGRHSWDSDREPEYGQTIHFTCNTGYTLFGSKTIRCTKTGEYDSELPQCIADCPKPQHVENTNLTADSLLKSFFPSGTEITYECIIGYDKVSGTGIMKCDDGKWTEPDIICRKKDCGLPEAKPHMLFDTSQGTLFGAMVKVTCEEGYQIIGSSYKQCLDIGWFGTADCVIVTCPKPTKVENGKNSWNSDNKPEYQQTINFTCNTGYTLFGNETIRCTKTGEYDFELPRCIADCPKPQNVENTILTADSLLKSFFPGGTVITYECIIGYNKVSGTGIIKCVDGKWTEPDIICKKDCGLPEAEPHMLFNTSEGTLFGAMVKVTCEEGYWVNGSNYKHCLDTGWFGIVDCVPHTCPKPTKVENGEHSWNSDDKPEYQQTINFTCNTGYTMVGIETIRCTETAKYDYEPPQCIATCPIPKSVENMVLTDEFLLKKDFLDGANVTYECRKGFVKESGSEIITCIDGNWTKPDLICKSHSIETINKGNAPFLSRLAIIITVCCVVGFILNIFLVRRQCSNDTGEELTPEIMLEIMQFQTF